MAVQIQEDTGLPDMMESLHLDAKSLAPRECKIILEDCKVLHELKNFCVAIGDRALAKQYTTIQCLLRSLQNLKECIGDKEKLATWIEKEHPLMSDMVAIPGSGSYKRGLPPEMEKQSVRTARNTVQHIPAIYQERHRKLTEILCKLSNNARECLKAGIKIQDVEDAWDLALQEANYSFLSDHK